MKRFYKLEKDDEIIVCNENGAAFSIKNSINNEIKGFEISCDCIPVKDVEIRSVDKEELFRWALYNCYYSSMNTPDVPLGIKEIINKIDFHDNILFGKCHSDDDKIKFQIITYKDQQ